MYKNYRFFVLHLRQRIQLIMYIIPSGSGLLQQELVDDRQDPTPHEEER